jgi:hypothetical protein
MKLPKNLGSELVVNFAGVTISALLVAVLIYCLSIGLIVALIYGLSQATVYCLLQVKPITRSLIRWLTSSMR